MPDETDVRTLTTAIDQPRMTIDVPMAGYFNRMINLLPGFESTLFTKDTRPDTLSFDRLNEMRRDSMIKNVLVLRKAPILAQMRKATIDCDDPDQKAFFEEVLLATGIVYRLARTSLSAYDFGVAFHEKRFQLQDVEAIRTEHDDATGEDLEIQAWEGNAYVYKEIVSVNPATIKEIRRRKEDRNGKPGDESFDGFVQRGLTKDQKERWVVAERAFVFTYNSEFGDLWGWPLIRDSYPYWFWKQFLWKIWMAWLERKAVPPTVVRHPIGRNPATQEDYASVAVRAGNAINTTTTIAMPSTAIDDKGTPAWDVKELVSTDRSDLFQRALDALDKAILRVTSTPERVFSEAQFGSRADAMQHTDTFLLTIDADSQDFVEAVNQWIIPPLQILNYGTSAVKTKLMVPGLTDDERAFLMNVFDSLLVNQSNQDRIDFEEIATGFGVPIKDVDTETQDEEPPPETDEFGNPLEPAPEEDTGEPPPDNLVLSDFEEVLLLLSEEGQVYLAGGLADLSRYEITRDAASKTGWRVVDKQTGKRLTGFVAMKIVAAFQNRSATEAKAAAKKAQTEAAKEARKKASEAKKAQTATQSAAKKAQREAIAAGKKAQAEAKRAGTKAQTEARKAQTAAKRATDKSAREATRAQTTKERTAKQAERKQEADAKREANKQAHDSKVAQTKADREAKQQQREQSKTEQEQSNAEAAHAKAQVATVQAERSKLEKETAGATVNTQAALQKITGNGYTVSGGVVNDHDAAVSQAHAIAQQNPNELVTVIRVGTGYVVASKPRDKVAVKAPAPSNVAAHDLTDRGGPPADAQDDLDAWLVAQWGIELDDPEPESDEGYHDSSVDVDFEGLLSAAEERIMRFLDGEESEGDDELTRDLQDLVASV